MVLLSSSSSDSILSLAESSELVPSGSTLETLLAAYDSIDDTANSTETREYVTHFREEALRTLMNNNVQSLTTTVFVNGFV
jgi:hypothetical protein